MRLGRSAKLKLTNYWRTCICLRRRYELQMCTLGLSV